MRTRIAFGFLVAASSGGFVSACLNTSSTCEEHLRVCGDAGAAGSSATGGASGGESGAAGTSSSGAGGASGGAGHGGSANGGSSGTSGESGAAGEGVVPCDTSKSPSTEACLVGNDFAIFVAPTGKDGASGTKAGPVKTIAKAVELAGDTKIVIACDGTYDEQVKLTTGAKLYGGFACPGSATPWSYDASKKATVAPSARGLALSIATGVSAVVIEDFEFDAQDGIDPGESSVAAFVNTSTSVALTRVKLVAGKGVDGANGTVTQVIPPDPTTLDGHSAMGSTGGTPNPIACTAGGSTKGGAGGNGGAAVTGGGPGTPDLGGGQGGAAVSCGTGGFGKDGSGATPQPPAAGATKLGSITAAGWTGAPGVDGAPGSPGQGGGGGAGKDMGGGGGGGAAGGCGGAGGTGGKAGGSSIALLVLNSTLSMTANDLVAGNAGKGGNGVAGQDGLPAGNGGLPTIGGCQGGAGGKGGAGGAGGGAAGGASVGIVYQGPMPTRDSATTTVTGTAGAKGLGGATPTNDGIAGVKQDVLQVP